MQDEYDFSTMEKVPNLYKGPKVNRDILVPPEAAEYFEELSKETGLQYTELIRLYLLDCAQNKRKLRFT